MAKTSTERARTFKQRRREAAKERATMLNEFILSFPGQLRFSVFPADDPHGDLDQPGGDTDVFSRRGKSRHIAKFAHARDLSVDDLFDQLAIEMEKRLKGRGMLPDTPRVLVE